jgi:virginiamycin A acetyltransferase
MDSSLMNSFDNFLYDTFLRKHENSEILIALTQSTTLKQKKEISRITLGDLSYWQAIYNDYVTYLKNHVSLIIDEQEYAVDTVAFHSKYGWIVHCDNAKAYLGKVAIIGDIKLSIGARSYISGPGLLRGTGKISIGSFCSIGFGLYIHAGYDQQPINQPASIGLFNETRMAEDGFGLRAQSKAPQEEIDYAVTIGNDVWLGRQVDIMNGVNIGHGCVLGAHALVTRDCEPFGIYGGVPAKLIRYRFSAAIIEQLMALQWWFWSEEKISRNTLFFETDLEKFDGNLHSIISE